MLFTPRTRRLARTAAATGMLLLTLCGVGCGGGSAGRGPAPLPVFATFQRDSGDAFKDRIVEDLFRIDAPPFRGMALLQVTDTGIVTTAGSLLIEGDTLRLLHGQTHVATLQFAADGPDPVLAGLRAHQGGVLANANVRMKVSGDAFVLVDPLIPMRVTVTGPLPDASAFELGALTTLTGRTGFYVSPAWMLTQPEFLPFLVAYSTWNPISWRRDYSEETDLDAAGLKQWELVQPLDAAGWQVDYAFDALQPFFFGLAFPNPPDPDAFLRQYVHTLTVSTVDESFRDTLALRIQNFKLRAKDMLCPDEPALPPQVRLVGMINWFDNYAGGSFERPYALHSRARMEEVIQAAHAEGMQVIAYVYVELPAEPDNQAALAELLDLMQVTETTSFDGFYLDGLYSGNYLRSRLFMLQLRTHPDFGLEKFLFSHSSSQGLYKLVEIRPPFDNYCNAGVAWENFGVMSDDLLRLNFPTNTVYDLLPERPRTLPDGTPLSTEDQFPMALRNGQRFRDNPVLERPSRDRSDFPLAAYQAAWAEAILGRK